MFRISVTALEKFRRVMAGASPYDTEQSLLDCIKGLFTGTDKTRFGQAYHSIIEGKFQVSGNRIFTDNRFVFEKVHVAPAMKFRTLHPFMIYETSASKIYETTHGVLKVNARIDGMEGLELHDQKTKFRSVDFMDYIASSQWKLYLDMMDSDVFYYNIFEIKKFPDPLRGNGPWVMPKDLQVIAHEPLQCLRYEGMSEDVQSLVNSFMDYIHDRNIYHLLKPATNEVFDF